MARTDYSGPPSVLVAAEPPPAGPSRPYGAGVVMTTTPAQARDVEAPATRRPVPRSLFTVTTFFGSFLLFQVQPMVARLALPDLGGAAAVWNSAMLVYQALLLAGYAWAHWLHRFPVRRQVLLHLALLGLALFWLPVGLASMEPPTGSSVVLFVPLLLLVSVGPVILVVSAQAPMMQGWFAAGHGQNPYPLYAASNFGSFAGLLAYPLVVEPTMRLGAQRWTWSAGYGLLILLVAGCGYVAARSAARAPAPFAEVADVDEPADDGPVEPITRRRTAMWLALSAVPSGLMLSTTTLLSTDIMAMPLLWAIPLGLYLLSFTVAFADRRGAANLITRVAPALLLVLGAIALLSKGLTGYPVAAFSVVTLFAVAVALHSRLYDSRPPIRQLTRFYLTTAVGGALGGLFCGLIAPLAFDWVYEHPILVVAAAALVPLGTRAKKPRAAGDAAFPVRAAYLVTLVSLMLALGGTTTIPASFDGNRARSYFGVYTVADKPDAGMRVLVHGGTVHGMQLLDTSERDEPTMYYGSTSGVGLVMARTAELFGDDASVGVVGLGTGTLACFKRPGETWQFFEIDPLMVDIARGKFHFLADCAPDAEMTVGDARLELGKMAPDSYDLLAVDAFSSDAIPMHLMTREAFELYDRVVRDDGLLLVHITNKYLSLEPVLASLVGDAGWTAAVRADTPAQADAEHFGYVPSRWVALSRTPGQLDARLAQVGGEWRELVGDDRIRPWTDDYASVLPLLR